jgi:HEAT repeat protein/beta-lactamase regulating signal transducer with metallopeptidase domain
MTPMNPMELLDAGLKATLVLGLAGLAALSLRRASAASRHLVWTLGVAAALVLPSLRALAPRWELPLLPAGLSASQGVGSAEGAARLAPGKVLSAAEAAPRASLSHSAPIPSERRTPTPSERDQKPFSLSSSAFPWPAISGATLLVMGWLLGAVVVAFPLVLGVVRTQWLGRRSPTFHRPEWTALVNETAARIGLTRPVRLLKGRAGSMPMAWGLLRPVVLLPEEAETWPEIQRRAVLTHELAHVKRHDCLTQALGHAACAFYWFHPLAWVAARRLRVERERACDDLVLRTGSNGPDYADHLLRLARSAGASGQPAWAAVAMARPSQLEGRLLAILDPSLDRGGPSRRNVLLTIVAATLLVVSLAGLEPWARPALAAVPPEALTSVEPEVAAALGQETAGPAAPQMEPTPEANEPTKATAASGAQQDPTPEPQPSAGGKMQPSQERVVAALSGALRDEDAEVRKEAVFSLGQLRAESSATALAGALGDAEGEVRAQAAFALGELRVASAVDALGKALASDSEAEVRQQAAFALGQIRAESAVPALMAALRDKEGEVRQQVCFALGQIRDPRAVSGLAAAVADSDAEVRQQAVFALGQLRAEEAAGPLTGALKDADAEVRQQAAFALGQLGSEKAVPALIAALKDASAEVREQAAFALGQVGDESASDALSAALKDAEADVRRQAAFALGQLAR